MILCKSITISVRIAIRKKYQQLHFRLNKCLCIATLIRVIKMSLNTTQRRTMQKKLALLSPLLIFSISMQAMDEGSKHEEINKRLWWPGFSSPCSPQVAEGLLRHFNGAGCDRDCRDTMLENIRRLGRRNTRFDTLALLWMVNCVETAPAEQVSKENAKIEQKIYDSLLNSACTRDLHEDLIRHFDKIGCNLECRRNMRFSRGYTYGSQPVNNDPSTFSWMLNCAMAGFSEPDNEP